MLATNDNITQTDLCTKFTNNEENYMSQFIDRFNGLSGDKN